MAVCTTTQNLYKGDGVTKKFPFTFEYPTDRSDFVKVALWDQETLEYVDTTDWSFDGPTVVMFDVAPPLPDNISGVVVDNIRIYRVTDVDPLEATFYPGSAIKADDLNDTFVQLQNSIQEIQCYDNNDSYTGDIDVLTFFLKRGGDSILGYIDNESNLAFRLPVGSTAQRPSSPKLGDSRYNTTINKIEFYESDGWVARDSDISTLFKALPDDGSPITSGEALVPIVFSNGVLLPDQTSSYAEEGAIRFNLSNEILEIYINGDWTNAFDGNITPDKLSTGGPYWDTDGNVGIGTSTPLVELSVNGQAQINKPSDFWTTNGSYYTVADFGSLATQGSYGTHLTSNGYRGASNQWVSLGVNNTTGAAQIELTPTGYISFNTEDNKATGSSSAVTRRMTVASDGNVGIGVYSPQQKLVLSEPTGSLVGARMGFVNQGDRGVVVGFVGHGANPNFAISSLDQETHHLTVGAGGNVGIGASSPQAKLSLEENGPLGISIKRTGSSASTAEIENSANRLQFSYNGTAITFLTGTTPTEVARFNSAGDMGLGKTNPQERLDVTGNGRFSGTVSAQGSVLTSDQRFKENITDAKSQLADVTTLGNQLRNWDWSDDAPVKNKETRFLGLIAQEVETICPGLVTTITETKQGAELTPETVVPAVYESQTLPAVFDDEGEVIAPETTKEVLVREEEIIPATYEELDDSYKGIKNDVLIMKLLGAVAELSAEVDALKKEATKNVGI